MEYWQAAESLLGAEFFHAGRSRHRFDCAGLILLSAWHCSLAVEDFRDYARRPDPEVLLREVRARCAERPRSEWQSVGRVLVMRHVQIGEVLREMHFAIAGPHGYAIHMGRTCETFWPKDETVASVWLLNGVQDDSPR